MCVPKALRAASALSSADPLPPLPWRISLGFIWDVTPPSQALLQFPSFWGAGRFCPGWERFNKITGGVVVAPEGTGRQLVPHAGEPHSMSNPGRNVTSHPSPDLPLAGPFTILDKCCFPKGMRPGKHLQVTPMHRHLPLAPRLPQ